MLSAAQLTDLTQFDSPTVSNAIEFFGVRPRTAGFMDPSIRKIFDDGRRVIGYAVTAKISALTPPTDAQKQLAAAYYRRVHATLKPTLTVLQDVDSVPIGSFWGEVQVSVHRALGCVGVVTNGGVRDLDEVQAIGFEYFASCRLVSHAYVHVDAIDCPVEVGGLTVHPGDLLHADRHGVVCIPVAVAPYLAEACRTAQAAEAPVITNCRRHFPHGDADVEAVEAWRAEVAARRTKAFEKFSTFLHS